MGLNYPNRSRTFDAAKGIIRFWGYDRVIEVSFFLETAALRKLIPETSAGELDILELFDAVRDRIHQVADKVYFRRPKGSYRCDLVAEDF
jgi:hypothetical protein